MLLNDDDSNDANIIGALLITKLQTISCSKMCEIHIVKPASNIYFKDVVSLN